MSGISFLPELDMRHAKSGFARLIALGSDLSDPLNLIGAALEDTVLERFETNIAADGTPWAPSERALAQNGRTLVDQAHLVESISYEVSGDELSIGSNLVYAAIHQSGGKAGRNLSVTLPARAFLGLSSDDEANIDHILNDALEAAWSAGQTGGVS